MKQSKKMLAMLLVLMLLIGLLPGAALADNSTLDDVVTVYSGTNKPYRTAYVKNITMTGAVASMVEGSSGTSPVVYLDAATPDDAVLSTAYSPYTMSSTYTLEVSGIGDVQLVNGQAAQTVTAVAKMRTMTLGTTTWNITYMKAVFYNVTLPEGEGYVAAAVSGSASPVVGGGSYSFTVNVNEATHEKGPDFAVKANGTVLTPNDSGVYTISDINEDQTVTVEGVVERSPYFVYSFGSAEANLNDVVEIPVSIQTNLAGTSARKSVQVVKYNPAALELTGVAAAGCFAGKSAAVDTSAAGYAVVTLGDDAAEPVSLADGQLFTLSFKLLGAGTSTMSSEAVSASTVTAASAEECRAVLGRDLYLGLEDGTEKAVADLTVSQAGEVRLYTVTQLDAPVLTGGTAAGANITVTAPAASAQDAAAAIQYRMSADGETWEDEWQTSSVFAIPTMGQTYWFQARYAPSNTTYWSVSEPSNAVSVSTVVVTGVSLDRTEASIGAGAAVQLTATVVPADATNPAVTWTSSDTAVATVSNGLVTGVAAGEATITAAAGSESATCSITVRENTPVEADPFDIYDDTAGSNKKPYNTAYVTKVTLSGVKVESSTCVASGKNFNVEVVLDYTTEVGAAWNLSYTMTGNGTMIQRVRHTVGPIVWNEDGTANQSYTASYNNSANYTSVWNIHYVRALSPEARRVINLIDAIGDVDRTSGPAITAAREAYDALSAADKARISNYDVLVAAEELFASLSGDYTTLDAPVLDATAATVTCTIVTLAAPAASAQDPAATVQYRMSVDNQNWTDWQAESVFSNLHSQTTYYFQARYYTSDLVNFDHSAPSGTITVTTADPIIVEVNNYTEFKAAYSGAVADGTETIIRLLGDVHQTQDDKDKLHMPANAVVTIEGAGGGLYVNHGSGNYGFYVDAGGTLTLRDLTIGQVRNLHQFYIPENCWPQTFRIDGDGATVNIDNVRYYNNMGIAATSLVSAANNVSATVNVYSLAANPYFTGIAFSLSYGGNCTLNLMPTGDIYINGQVLYATQVNVIPQPGFEIKSGAAKSGSAWTAMEAEDIAELNAGKAVTLDGLAGYSLLVSDAAAVPVAFTAPTVAEAGTPEAETADIVYTPGYTSVTFVANNKKSPQGESFFMIYGPASENSDRGTASFWRAYSDASDGLLGNGNSFTCSGLSEDTSYTYRVGWFTLEAGWSDVIVDVPVHTLYHVNPLSAPTLSEQVEKTETSITLTAPAASTQDTGATLAYRISADGETWGEWQDSLTFEGLTPATTYYFQAKYVAVDYHWSDSEPSEALEVMTKVAALTAPVLDAAAAAATHNTVTLAAPAASAEDAEAAVQYRMSEDGETWGEWQSEAAFTGLTPKTAYQFQARYVPSTNAWLASEPSEAITVTTTKDPNAPTIVVNAASGYAGGEVQVTISLLNNPGVAHMELALHYDAEKLELVSVTDGGILPGASFGADVTANPYALVWDNGSDTTASGTLATATFRLKANEGSAAVVPAAVGDTARVWITFDPDNVYNADMDNVAFEVEESVVTEVEAPVLPQEAEIDIVDDPYHWDWWDEDMLTLDKIKVNVGVVNYTQDGSVITVVLTDTTPLDATITAEFITYSEYEGWTELNLSGNEITLVDGIGEMTLSAQCQFNTNDLGTKTYTLKFARSDKMVSAESVTLNKTELTFDREHTEEQLTATVLPENTFDKTVTWTSSDESVATVDANGLVKSVAVGTATITAACGNVSATCAVSVTVAPYIPTPSQIDLEDRNFEKYGMCPFTMTGATVSDKVDSYTVDEATKTVRVILNEEVPLGTEVTWTYVGDYPSSYSWMNPSLNQSGNVVTLVDGCGTMDAVLQVNSSNYGDLGSVTYHVIFARSDRVVAVSSIELDKTALTLTVNGASEQLTATVLPENAFDKSVTWATSDENVATVDQTGLVKPVGAGTATITVSQGELMATCAVEVRFVEVTGISLSETEVNLVVGGGGVNVTANLEPENASDKTVTWTLEGEDYVRISASGTRCTLYPKAEGDAVLTATTANGQTATCAIHVAYVSVETVNLDKTELILSTTGSAEAIRATLTPDNCSTKTMNWESSDPYVASVSVRNYSGSSGHYSEGTVTPKAEGITNITVSSPDGPSAICVVKVYYVADVIDAIDALPERVTRDDADAVNAAKALYDALNDEAKTLVTNADKLQAALDALASFEGTDPATMASPTLSAESAVVGYQTVTLTATGEPADSTATIEYRVSTDGESWGKWQASGEFKNLRPNTTHYYQARFAAGDVVNYLDSEPCEAVAIMNKAPASTTVEVANWEELKSAMQGAATDGTETVIRLTQTVFRYYDMRTDSITVPDGAIIVLTAAEGAALVNAGTNVAFNLRNGNIITIKDMVCANITEADRRGLNSGVYSARLFNSNYAYTANVDNARMISGITYGVFTGSQATVNFYSGVITNPVYDCMNTNDNRPIEGVTRVNLIPYGDLALEGDLKDVKDKIFFAPIVPISAVFTQTANLGTYTALTAGKVELLNAGGQFPASGIFGIRVLTNGNTAPAPFAELTIAEEGTPEAETADVTYVRSETQMVFTVKNKPANSVFFIKSSSYPYGNGYYYAWPDGGEGNVYTVPGMRSDTAYTIKLMLASLDTAYTNVESVHELRSTYTAVQLDPPTLTGNGETTDTTVTLEAPAASAQDATATVRYRVSADGETWGDWQESPTFEGLTPSTTYSFQAMYVAGDDHWSDSEASNTVQLTTKAKVLDAPVLESGTADVTSITLTAPAASEQDETATVQYRMSADGETWGDWQDEAVFTGLTANTTYYFQARYYAVSAAYQNSAESNTLSLKTLADPNAAAFTVGSVTGAPGEEVQVEISMKNNPGIVAANLELNYDQDKLELVSVENAALLPGYVGSNSTAVYPFIISWEDSTAAENLTVNGLLATATFRIKAEAAEGDVARVWITYDPENVYDYDMTNVTFETEEGAVTVGAAPAGFGVLVENRTASAVTSLTEGSYSGEVSFTVTNSRACTVFVRDMDGGLTPLAATAAEETNTYSFTVTVDKPLTVVIALKGDVNGDGVVSVTDSSLINRSLLSESNRAYRALGPEEELIADVNGSGTITVSDASLLNRSLLSESAAAYKALEW